jgi:hypothetical protein
MVRSSLILIDETDSRRLVNRFSENFFSRDISSVDGGASAPPPHPDKSSALAAAAPPSYSDWRISPLIFAPESSYFPAQN